MPERRRFPRTTLETTGAVACIRIDPDIVGIIMNVSGTGLGFQCMTPVEPRGTIRFSLMQHDRCLDACGDLAWLDATQTSGGLRFTTLSSEARNQIDDWTTQPVALVQEQDKGSKSVAAGAVTAGPPKPLIRPAAKKVPNAGGIPKFSLFSACHHFYRRLWDRQAHSGKFPSLGAAGSKLTGFSAGFATGLLITLLGVSILLVSYVHRREVGESLISLGERLAALPAVEGKSVVRDAKVAAVLPQQPAASGDARKPITPAIPMDQEKIASVRSRLDGGDNIPLEPPMLTVPVRRGGTAVRHISPIHAHEVAPAPPAVSLAASALPLSKLLLEYGLPNAPLARIDRARGSVAGEVLGLQLYFDIGRFRDKVTARTVSDKVARLGLPTTVLQKSFLWKNSYQVLVGPYRNEEDEKRIQSELRSLGYTPRPFERGSRTFEFRSQLDLNGSRLPFGELTISWESYATEVRVRFVQGSHVMAADGRWMRIPQRYSQDEYVYGSGSKILHEIHFSGLNRVLLFGKPASNTRSLVVPPS